MSVSAKVDPRVLRTREFLQQAFYTLMAEKEFDDITVQDIAERARVNRATFYDHFDDKFDLLNHSVQEGLQKALDGKLPDTPTFTLANVRVLTIALCEILYTYLGRCATPTKSSYKPLIMIQMQSYVSELLIEWIGNSQPIPETMKTTPETIAALTSWVIFGLASQWSLAQRGRKHVSAEQMADESLPLLVSGLKGFFDIT